MSGSKNKIYYWDACVYLAWLRDEAAYKAELPMMAEIIRENSVRENTIITSTVTLIEVLSTKLTGDQEKTFRDCFKNPKHVLYDVDPAVAFRARELREYYVTHKIKNRSLSTPDAIHLATALIHGASSFHTFDNGKSKDDDGKKGIPLLDLGNKIAGHPLEIIKPFIHFTPSLLPEVK
jgi:predicted nucleic acid-binding protein